MKLRHNTAYNSGVYCLIIQVPFSVYKIGALGEMNLGGCYIYTGSARKNLIPRLRRHRSREKKIRWHIDYLLKDSQLTGIHVKPGALKSEECRMANALSEHFPGVTKFGCSDCKCKSHLFKINDFDKAREILMELGYTILPEFV